MKLTVTPFGKYSDGREAKLITIESAYGKVSFTDYAASVVSIEVPDKNGASRICTLKGVTYVFCTHGCRTDKQRRAVL